MKNVEHLQDDSCKINSTFITRKRSKHAENTFFTLLRNHTQRFFFCVCVCVCTCICSWRSFWDVCAPIMPWCFPAPWCLHFWLWRWCWSAQSIYWSSYLVLWQAESINQEAGFALTYSRHISALQDTRSQCYPAKFDQQMQFPCATAISDEDVIMWNRAKW